MSAGKEGDEEQARKRPKLMQEEVPKEDIVFPNVKEVSLSNISALDSAHDAIFHRLYPESGPKCTREMRITFASQVETFNRKMVLCMDSRIRKACTNDENRREFLRLLMVEKVTREAGGETVRVRLRPHHFSFQVIQLPNKKRDICYHWKTGRAIAKGDVILTLRHDTLASEFVITHNKKKIFHLSLHNGPITIKCDAEAWHAISKRLRAPYDHCSSSFILSTLAVIASPEEDLLRALRQSVWVDSWDRSLYDDINCFSFFKDSWYARRDHILRIMCNEYHLEEQILLRPLVFIVLEYAREFRLTEPCEQKKSFI